MKRTNRPSWLRDESGMSLIGIIVVLGILFFVITFLQGEDGNPIEQRRQAVDDGQQKAKGASAVTQDANAHQREKARMMRDLE